MWNIAFYGLFLELTTIWHITCFTLCISLTLLKNIFCKGREFSLLCLLLYSNTYNNTWHIVGKNLKSRKEKPTCWMCVRHSVVSNSLQSQALYVAHQAPLSMGFSRQEYWSGLPCTPPRDLPNPEIQPGSPTLQMDSLSSEPLGKPKFIE